MLRPNVGGARRKDNGEWARMLYVRASINARLGTRPRPGKPAGEHAGQHGGTSV